MVQSTPDPVRDLLRDMVLFTESVQRSHGKDWKFPLEGPPLLVGNERPTLYVVPAPDIRSPSIM